MEMACDVKVSDKSQIFDDRVIIKIPLSKKIKLKMVGQILMSPTLLREVLCKQEIREICIYLVIY